jgi:hypothetical protein
VTATGTATGMAVAMAMLGTRLWGAAAATPSNEYSGGGFLRLDLLRRTGGATGGRLEAAGFVTPAVLVVVSS